MMSESYDLIAVAILFAVLVWLLWELHRAPVVCDCFENHLEPENRRIKCQYEYALEAERKDHANTKSQLVAAVGDLGVAQADVSRLHKELDYLQMKYERLKERERVTVLPDWSEIETDPRKIVFGGEEVSEDVNEYQDRRA